jgi:DNA-binding NarL/FixJ family response regulator
LIRVVYAEDHALVRKGISSLLRSLPDVELVAEAANGRDALDEIQRHSPDIALMDISMEGMNGLEATARISREWPDVRVIILSMHDSEEHVAQALRAGAAGYLLKDADINEVEIALRAVAQGSTFLSPRVSQHLVRDFVRRVDDTDPLAPLTPRQREILQLLAEGKTTKQMASTLKVSVKTVETHRAAIMKRLNIYDVPSLVRFAINAKIID